jgi:hypothetical protein
MEALAEQQQLAKLVKRWRVEGEVGEGADDGEVDKGGRWRRCGKRAIEAREESMKELIEYEEEEGVVDTSQGMEVSGRKSRGRRDIQSSRKTRCLSKLSYRWKHRSRGQRIIPGKPSEEKGRGPRRIRAVK